MTPPRFLDTLPLSAAERARLEQLAPASAFDLLSRRRAAKEAFDSHVGVERADAIAALLETLLSPVEREALAAPPAPGRRRLGARLDRR